MIFGQKKVFFLLLCIIPFFFSFSPQEARVNQNKIDRDRKMKQKEIQQRYDKAIERHKQIQSKETRKRMKETKKKSRKMTPLQ